MTALRIDYELEGGAVRITSAKPVNVRVPVSVPLQVTETGVGAWVETRDANDAPVWGRVLDENFLAGEVRLQRGDGLGSMTRVPLPVLRAQILVPVSDGGRVLFRHRSAAGKKAKTLAEHKF